MNYGKSRTADVGANEEARKFCKIVRVLAAERETFLLNIDKVSTERGSLREDKTTLTGRVADLTE